MTDQQTVQLTGVPERPSIPPIRLLATLGIAGALAGALIVGVFKGTEPTIRAYKAQVLREAIRDVLQDPDSFDTLYVGAQRIVPSQAEGEPVYVGHREGVRVGVAIVGADPGFQDVIRLIFGYDPPTGTLLGMKVLESKETPGLGDKIQYDDAFVGQFRGAAVPLVGVKPGRREGLPNEIDMITGATISSRAVVRIINAALERIQPALASRDTQP